MASSSKAKTKAEVTGVTYQGIRILLGCTELNAKGKSKPKEEQTMLWPALLSKNATLPDGDHVWVFDPEEEDDAKSAHRLPFIDNVYASWGTTFIYLPCRSENEEEEEVWELKKYKLNEIIVGLDEFGKPIPQSALNASWETYDKGTGHRDVYLLNSNFLKKKEDFTDVADFFENKLKIAAHPVSESIQEVATDEFIEAFVNTTESYVCDDLNAAEEAYEQRVKPFAAAHARKSHWKGTARIVMYNKRECRIAKWEEDSDVDSDATLSAEEDVSDVDAGDARTLLAAVDRTPRSAQKKKNKRKSPPVLSSPPRSQKKPKSRQSLDEEMETLQNVVNTIKKHASLREKVESELAAEKKKAADLAAELDAEKKKALEQKKKAVAEKKKVTALAAELDAEKKKKAVAVVQQSGPVTAFGKILDSLLFNNDWDEATTFLHLSHIIRDTAVNSFIDEHSKEKTAEYLIKLLADQDVKSILKAFLVEYNESLGETAVEHWGMFKPKLNGIFKPKLSGNEDVQEVYKLVLASIEVPAPTVG